MVLTEEERRNWEAIVEEATRPAARAEAEAKRRRKAIEKYDKMAHRGCIVTIVSLITLPFGLVGIFFISLIRVLGSLNKPTRSRRK